MPRSTSDFRKTYTAFQIIWRLWKSGAKKRILFLVDERPRERMARGGAVALSDAELIALLIEPGRRGKSSLDIGRELVANGLLALARQECIPGKAVGSLGATRVARIGAALELGRRIAAQSTTSSEPTGILRWSQGD